MRFPASVSVAGLFAFLAGLGHVHKINVVGEVYLMELALPVAALAALGGVRTVARSRMFWALLGTLALSLLGYILSDTIRDNPPSQYLKGWGRIGILATDFICLAILACRDRATLWWLALGIGIGGVGYLRLVQHLPLPVWKFGYAEPMTLLCAALAAFVPRRWAAAGFVVLAIMSMKYDFRIHSGICLFIAGVLWLRAPRPTEPLRLGAQFVKIAMASVIGVVTLSVLLHSTDSEWHQQRRGTSSANRELGLQIGVEAIKVSPWIGVGSWGGSQEILEISRRLGREREDRDKFVLMESGSAMATHSELLQAWVEGGILGAAFFLFYGTCLIAFLSRHVLSRSLDVATPVLLYFHAYGLWNLLMSPFAATTRIQIALSATVVLVLSLRHVSGRSSKAPEQPVVAKRFRRPAGRRPVTIRVEGR
jgi:hypothetical protein